MATYYVGWDVGAWHCQKNTKSRDAIVIQKKDEPSNNIFYGNAAPAFDAKDIDSFFKRIFPGCIDSRFPNNYIIAVDAALGWPTLFRKLLSTEEFTDEDYGEVLSSLNPKKGKNYNPLLLRGTDMDIFSANKGVSPLSAVQDMIGSQSTKILFFLRKFGFHSKNCIWSNSENEVREIYPSILKKNGEALKKTNEWKQNYQQKVYCFCKRGAIKRNWNSDIEDAFYALWAAQNFSSWETTTNSSETEGNIWAQPNFFKK